MIKKQGNIQSFWHAVTVPIVYYYILDKEYLETPLRNNIPSIITLYRFMITTNFILIRSKNKIHRLLFFKKKRLKYEQRKDFW